MNIDLLYIISSLCVYLWPYEVSNVMKNSLCGVFNSFCVGGVWHNADEKKECRQRVVHQMRWKRGLKQLYRANVGAALGRLMHERLADPRTCTGVYSAELVSYARPLRLGGYVSVHICAATVHCPLRTAAVTQQPPHRKIFRASLRTKSGGHENLRHALQLRVSNISN